MPRYQNTTSAFNAVDLLNIKSTHPNYFNCVGVTQKGQRCRRQVAQLNVDVGIYQLSQLPERSTSSEALQDKLEDIAGRLLCLRDHQEQAPTVATKWKTTIVAEQARRARLGQPRRSRRIVRDTDGDISMSREARARERRLEEQRAEQLRSGECPICYDPLSTPCETACVHIFCHSCVVPWIETHGSCPTCRAQATVHELVVIDVPRTGPFSRPREIQPARVRDSRARSEEPSSPPAAVRARTPQLSGGPRALSATPQPAIPVQQAVEAREHERRVWTRRIEQLSHDCPICIDALETPCETPCSHIFCQGCLTRWLQNSRTCPECRAEVQVGNLKLI